MSGNLILLATTLLYLAVVLALVLLTPDHYTLFQVPLSGFDIGAASCYSTLPGECCLWRHSCHLLDGVDSVQLGGGHSHGNDVIFFI